MQRASPRYGALRKPPERPFLLHAGLDVKLLGKAGPEGALHAGEAVVPAQTVLGGARPGVDNHLARGAGEVQQIEAGVAVEEVVAAAAGQNGVVAPAQERIIPGPAVE